MPFWESLNENYAKIAHADLGLKYAIGFSGAGLLLWYLFVQRHQDAILEQERKKADPEYRRLRSKLASAVGSGWIRLTSHRTGK